jgi:hypothetical protein
MYMQPLVLPSEPIDLCHNCRLIRPCMSYNPHSSLYGHSSGTFLCSMGHASYMFRWPLCVVCVRFDANHQGLCDGEEVRVVGRFKARGSAIIECQQVHTQHIEKGFEGPQVHHFLISVDPRIKHQGWDTVPCHPSVLPSTYLCATDSSIQWHLSIHVSYVCAS